MLLWTFVFKCFLETAEDPQEVRLKLVQTPANYEALQEVFQYACHEIQTLNEIELAMMKSKIDI